MGDVSNGISNWFRRIHTEAVSNPRHFALNLALWVACGVVAAAIIAVLPG